MVRTASFPQAEIEKVRAEILTELREEADDTRLVADRVLRERIYPPGHPFRRQVKGDLHSVEKLKSSDLAGFHKRYYRPDQGIVSVVGDIKPEEVFEKIGRAHV